MLAGIIGTKLAWLLVCLGCVLARCSAPLTEATNAAHDHRAIARCATHGGVAWVGSREAECRDELLVNLD